MKYSHDEELSAAELFLRWKHPAREPADSISDLESALVAAGHKIKLPDGEAIQMKNEPIYSEIYKPKHYQLEINGHQLEVKDIINHLLERWVMEYGNTVGLYQYANAIKYLLRAPFKGKLLQDLGKAEYCIEDLLKLLEADSEDASSMS